MTCEGAVDALETCESPIAPERDSPARTAPPPSKNADSAADAGEETSKRPVDHVPGDDEPDELLCPITKVMMRDPVFVAGSGNTYEREAIETYWRQTATRPVRGVRGAVVGVRRDPLTNLDLANDAIFTNWDKRREVQAWLAKHPTLTPEGWPDRDVPPPLEERRKAAGGRDGDGNGERSDAVGRMELLAQTAKLAAMGGVGLAVIAALFVATTSPAPSSDGLLSRWEFVDGHTGDGTARDATAGAVGFTLTPPLTELRVGSYAWRKRANPSKPPNDGDQNQNQTKTNTPAKPRRSPASARTRTGP